MKLTIKTKNETRIRNLMTELLSSVPKEHLAGLDEIEVLNSSSRIKIDSGKPKQVSGLYHRKHRGSPAKIQIFTNETFGASSPLLYYIPLLTKIMLASVLYHELGHHQHRNSSHSIADTMAENYAEKYMNKSVVVAFRPWLILLRPFKKLLERIVVILRRYSKT